MTNLLTLAARIEVADGADRALDVEIALAVGWKLRIDHHDDDMSDEVWTDPAGHDRAWNPDFTYSLDAAMSLVPEGFGWRLWVPNSDTRERPRVTIWGNGRTYAPYEHEAKTPALALAAAAIRARAS